MSTEIHPSLEFLQSALEDHADAMSSAAQILLHGLSTAGGEPPPWQRDVERIHQSARGIYRLVREQLVVENFPDAESSYTIELHGLRHELRGLLQNILGRCQLVLEEEEMARPVRQELLAITSHATACVQVLNRNSEGSELEGDVPTTHSSRSASPLEDDGAQDTMGLEIGTGRILVADDSASSREVLGRFLEAQGHEVHFATTGKEALESINASDFDVVLLDLIMPELNGFEVLKALRRQRKLRHTFVIIISGLDATTNAIRGIELGAVDFLARPIDLKLLRARVNACLERQRLRERELAQYFTPELARHLLRHPEQLEEGRSVEITTLFCDVVGFSRVSEQCGPNLTIRWLADVLETLSACIMEQKGVLVDFTGDQVMGLWGAPHAQEDQADRACAAALAMLSAMPQVNERWLQEVGFPTQVSIGINTGEAFVGNIGTPQKFKYGALGNTVNLASRVQGACKYARVRLLTTGNTISRLTGPLNNRRLGQIRVTNIAAPVHIHEIVPSTEDAARQRLMREYDHALSLFESGEFRKASSVLGSLLEEYPDDGPSLLLMSRAVTELLRHDTSKFDPVWELPGK